MPDVSYLQLSNLYYADDFFQATGPSPYSL